MGAGGNEGKKTRCDPVSPRRRGGSALCGTQGVPASGGGNVPGAGPRDVTRFRATRYSGATIKTGDFRSLILQSENHKVSPKLPNKPYDLYHTVTVRLQGEYSRIIPAGRLGTAEAIASPAQ